jgi:hypothetical protein
MILSLLRSEHSLYHRRICRPFVKQTVIDLFTKANHVSYNLSGEPRTKLDTLCISRSIFIFHWYLPISIPRRDITPESIRRRLESSTTKLCDTQITNPKGSLALRFGNKKFGTCIILLCIIPNYNQKYPTFLELFIYTNALHVSGCSSAHHQEHITVHTASGIVNCNDKAKWIASKFVYKISG